MDSTFVCPYHRVILQLASGLPGPGHGLHPLDRFKAEGQGQQSAAFIRPDTMQLSMVKPCLCCELIRHDTGMMQELQMLEESYTRGVE